MGRAGAGLIAVLLASTIIAPAGAQPSDSAESDPRTDAIVKSGLPIPRFVSLRSDQVNVRTGPGVRYPVEWVFVRAGMPVEITAEFDTWRRIRDVDGTQGWVHQSMLSGRRSFIVTGEIRSIRAEPNAAAAAIAQAEPGVMGRLRECRNDWCRVEVEGFKGWLRRADLWGAYAREDLRE